MKRIAAICLAVLLTVAGSSLALAQSGTDLFQQALRKERVDGDLKAAIALYQRILKEHAADRALSAKTLVQLGQAYEKMGNADARNSYQRVIREYADQSEQAAVARARLGALSAATTLTASGEPAIRRIWAGGDVDVLGAPTLDGKLLTFVDWTTGDLAVRDLVTGQNRRLTNKGTWANLAFALFSTPSPDGRRVAFTWYNEQGNAELRLIGMDGGEPRVLYANPEVVYVQPSEWSPDGKQLAVTLSRSDRVNQIALISTTDGTTRTLKTLDWRGAQKLSFSPDGKYLVYDFPPREDSPQRDIYVLATDGSADNVLVKHAAQDLVMGWTPDGKHVLFASDRTGGKSVWLAPVDNGKAAGEPVLAHRDAAFGQPMGFTHNGSFLYGGNASPKDLYVASIDPGSGKAIGAPARLVDNFVGANRAADWMRDGTAVVYLSDRQPGPANNSALLIVRSLETGAERMVPAHLGYLGAPRWSPDGRYIVVSGADQKGRRGIFRVDPESGEATMLVESGSRYFAGWSADAKSIIYRVQDFAHQTWAVVRQRLDNSETQDLFRVSGKRNTNLYEAEVSPDGRQVAFAFLSDSGLPPTLQVISSEGGETRQMLRAPAGYEIGTLTWSADSRYIFFVLNRVFADGVTSVVGTGTEKSRIMRVAATGGPAQETGVAMDKIVRLHSHPDGQRIGFTAGGGAAEVWVMENFLPKAEAKAGAKQR